MYAKGCCCCWWASLSPWHNLQRRDDKSRSSCCKAWLPESRWRGFYSISPAHPVSHLDRGSASLLTISTSSWPPIHPCCKLKTIQASLYQFISPIGSASCVTQWFLIVSAFFSLGAQANRENYLHSFLSRLRLAFCNDFEGYLVNSSWIHKWTTKNCSPRQGYGFFFSGED